MTLHIRQACSVPSVLLGRHTGSALCPIALSIACPPWAEGSLCREVANVRQAVQAPFLMLGEALAGVGSFTRG